MRILLALSLAAVLRVAQADDSFVVLDAVMPNGPTQPAWVVLQKRGRTYPIRNGEKLVALPAGRYKITFIDFDSDHQQPQRLRETPVLQLQPETILYVGRLEIGEPGSRQGYDLTIRRDLDLLKEACEVAPEVFARLPLKLAFGDPVAFGHTVCAFQE